MRKFRLFIFLLSFPIVATSSDIAWDEQSLIVADVNCDGLDDQSKIGYVDSGVIVHVAIGGTDKEISGVFGLGDPSSQSSLCGDIANLSKEVLPQNDSDVFMYGLGSVPEGHQSTPGCFGLRLSGGECDSIHIYWNHEQKQLSWWRL